MAVAGMNHFTILTDDLEKTLAFYAEHLGLKPGARPPFTFSGAWLYAEGGSDAILHVIDGVDRKALVKGVIDHMAFTGRDLRAAVGKLKQENIKYELRKQVGSGTWQLFFFDPNDAKIEIDYDPAEPAPGT